MGDRISMSISVDSPSDETLNQGPLVLLLQQQYEFPFGAISFFNFHFFHRAETMKKVPHGPSYPGFQPATFQSQVPTLYRLSYWESS